MPADEHVREHPARENPFTAEDVLAILRERRWLTGDPSPEHLLFCARAASMLGQFATGRMGLSELLTLVFNYDAALILQSSDTHAVLARYAARDVIRHLAAELLEPVPFDSDRFKQVVTKLKGDLELRGRDLFHPIRLVLTGRAGEGELDRVVLLLDEASALPFAVRVKPVRERMIEFCAALE